MATPHAVRRISVFRSIIFKNILLFLLILIVAVVPLALSYYEDSRDYEIRNLAAKLEVFAERGAARLDPEIITRLTAPTHKHTPEYREVLQALQGIETEFDVDNAVLMRRELDGHYTYIAIGHDGFEIGQDVHIHTWFRPTYKATEDTWQHGAMIHSQLFGGKVVDESRARPVVYLCRLFNSLNETALWHRLCTPPGTDQNFAQFLQINTPLKLDGKVVAILMLNKFADPVAAAVWAKTLQVVGLSLSILLVGLGLFGYASARMLQPLKNLTAAASDVAQGNLDITIPKPRRQDEIGRLAMTFDTMLEGLRQRDFIRDTFGRYLSKEVVEELFGSPDGLKIGGEVRQVTLLVSDLRGFTSMAAHLSPEDVLPILNRYLERMVDIIMRYRGTVDEFQGDGILAFFGAPLARPDDPERAIACAIEMQRALLEFNAEQQRRQLPELAMGIGINTGEVIVGNIGSEKRAKYGAVGSEINTAYRLESYTVGGQILISPRTYERAAAVVGVRGTMDVQFKGLEEPMTLYDVVSLKGTYACALPETAPMTFTPLDPPLPASCFLVEGKTVSDTAIPGQIIRLSPTAAEVILDGQVALHTNLKLILSSPAPAALPEIYAKVLEIYATSTSPLHVSACLALTSVPPEAKAFLEHLRPAAGQKDRMQVG